MNSSPCTKERMTMMLYNKKMTALTMILVLCTMLFGCSKAPAETIPTTQATEAVETTQAPTEAEMLELAVEGIEEQNDMMVVSTTFAQVKYPYAFADLIQVKAVNEETVASLEFTALISGKEYPLFALRFGADEGIILGSLTVEGESAPRTVAAEFYSADEAALGNQVNTFHAVQECFNDVVASLGENKNFSSAE